MDDTTAATRPDHGSLFGIATEQAGYFTTAQSRDCGFSSPLLTHHAKSGRFVRRPNSRARSAEMWRACEKVIA